MMFHIIWCYLFVIKYDLGIVGVGMSSSLSNFLIYSSVLIYTNSIQELKPAMKQKFFHKRTFMGTFQYLELGIPSAAMLCLEWWAYEVMTLMSGYLGVTEQASQIVLMNLIAFLFMAACGF